MRSHHIKQLQHNTILTILTCFESLIECAQEDLFDAIKTLLWILPQPREAKRSKYKTLQIVNLRNALFKPRTLYLCELESSASA